MQGKAMAAHMELRGRRVVQAAGRLWHSVEGGLLMALPYQAPMDPESAEIAGMLFRHSALGARYLSAGQPGHKSGIYVCRTRDYGFSSVQPRMRTLIRRGLEQCQVRRVEEDQLLSEGLRLNLDSMLRQGRIDPEFAEPASWRRLVAAIRRTPEIAAHGAFVDGQLAAYMITCREDGWLYVLHQNSREDLLERSPNHALTFTVTRDAMADPEIHAMSYGVISMVSNPGLHQYKLRIGYEVERYSSVYQLHPAMAPLLASRPMLWMVRQWRRRQPENQRLERVETVLTGARLRRRGVNPPGVSLEASQEEWSL